MDTAEKIRFGVGVFGVALLHAIGTYMLAFISGTTGGGPVVKVLTYVLLFPASLFPSSWEMPPIVGFGIWAAISLCWGFGIGCLIRFLANR